MEDDRDKRKSVTLLKLWIRVLGQNNLDFVSKGVLTAILRG